MAQFNFTRPHKLGSELCEEDRAEALARFPHRYTLDHKPDWAYATTYNGREYPPQFVSDWDWLAHTWFQVREDGRLDGRSHSCHSFPTWPEGRMHHGVALPLSTDARGSISIPRTWRNDMLER